ncbi:MAG: YggS family pyridoxal phosphate-dependent enzyme, partial [Eubacterium sp.]
GPMTENTEEIRKIFKQLKRMYDTMLKEYHGGENDIDSLSMGMTDDYPIAIEEGSSIVRIGRKIFKR